LFPEYYHRVVEVAVVRCFPDGRVTREFSTLVNPQRDIGATHIHGITASAVAHAPSFKDIAGDVYDLLTNSILVAHNARFDIGFLDAEFARLGVALPPIPSVCTLSLAASSFVSATSRSLSSCCKACGINHSGVHTAIGDARAVALLFARLIASMKNPSLCELGCDGERWPAGAYPALGRSGHVLTREGASVAASDERAYLTRLVNRLPIATTSAGPQPDGLVEYLQLLDQCLTDRLLTTEEAQGLLILATNWGMTKNEVHAAHQAYLTDLAQAALADGVVSEAERIDLLTVADWLGLSPEAVDSALGSASTGSVIDLEERGSLEGKRVCFTGELHCTLAGQPITREHAEQLAQESGMVVLPNVTKRLDMLVVADPRTQSTKARKARQYGIEVVAEPVFWQMIGAQVD
jgi:DNA polymerase-3 subunit epsilon